MEHVAHSRAENLGEHLGKTKGGWKMRSHKFGSRTQMLGTVAAAALIFLPTIATAQENDVPDQAAEYSDGLKEIVVQARKVSENLQDVPVAVTAFSGADLTNQGFQQFEDLANFTPGMVIRSGAAAPSSTVIALRGQLQNDILATLDPSVGTYVDGVYWARSYGLNANILDAASVQVLKGPQGTLFGRNTTGGAILISTNNPDMDEFSGSLSASYGRFNEHEMTGVINIPIVADRVALRLAGTRLKRDGYMLNVAPATAVSAFTPANATFLPRGPFAAPFTGQRYDGRDRWNGRAKLAIQASDTLELHFSGEFYKADESSASRQISYVPERFVGTGRSNYDIGVSASQLVGLATGSPALTATANGRTLLTTLIGQLDASPSTTSNNERPSSLVETKTLGFTGQLEVPWGEVKLMTGYRKVESSTILDVDGTPYPIFTSANQQKLSQYSGELQTTGKIINDRIDIAAGLFYFHETGTDIYAQRSLVGLTPLSTNSYGKISNDSMGVYAQATYRPVDALGITAGIRYSVDDKALESRNADYNRTTGLMACRLVPVTPYATPEVVAPAPCSLTTKDSFSGWSYNFGVDYRIDEGILVYASTAKGFRAGGANFRARTLSSFNTFEPERAYSYEVGVKTELFDRRVRLNVAAYQADIKDIQRSTIIAVAPVPPATVTTAATIVGNAGSVRIRGFEIETAVRPTEGFTLSGSVALVDPEYTSFADATGDRRQERFIGIARWQYSLAADYTAQIGSGMDLTLHVDYAWRGKTPTNEYFFAGNPNNEAVVDATTLPSLGLLGARASISWENLEFAVFGRNLTNERKFDNALAVFPIGFVASTRQEPTTYGVAVKIDF